MLDAKDWKHVAAIGKTSYSDQQVSSAWFADNRRLISTNWAKDEIHLLEVGKATPVATLNAGGGRPRCVALHPSEEWFAVCGEAMPVQIWHLPTSRIIKSWQLGPPEGLVSQVAFSPGGHYLATLNGNGTVYILSLDGVIE